MNNSIRNINIYNSPCNFDNWSKHFGAYFLANGDVFFKLFTFSDVKNVLLEIKPYGKPKTQLQMNKTRECVWEFQLAKGILQNGDRYRFILNRNNELISVKDPCSMWQDTLVQWSRIYNHAEFNWKDKDWLCGKIKNRVSRVANDSNRLSKVDSLRIYELHIGTFTKEGTFQAAKEKIKPLAEKFNFNAIEIMPVENTYSFNWGYDGVDKYAPNHVYGTPDDLKSLIDYAHSCGLNVIMDIVPNHLGPDIAQLQDTGPYTDGENCFGYKFNFEKDKYSHYVRDFIVGAALNWIINYHCDGLRVDMTKFMCSDYTMKQMAAEINYHTPDVFLIAEDGRDNDVRVTKQFPNQEIDENELNHEKFIDKISANRVSLSALGFDTEWDFPFHKQIAASVLGVWDCREKNICDFDYALRDAQTRVKYAMSHDEIGNIDGTRLITKIVAKKLGLDNFICSCFRYDKCKIAAHATQKILVSFLADEFETFNDEERKNFLQKIGVAKNITFDQVKSAYLNAVKMQKMVLGKVYSIPGPKMIFQGDESANLAYFKFFRKFSTGPENYLKDKGYEPGISAFNDSKLDSIKVCEKYSYINDGVANFVADINTFVEKNIALNDGHIEKTIVHQNTDIHAIHARQMYNEVFSISNFSAKNYENYGIMFPKGQWREIINSENACYGGVNSCINAEKVFENFSYPSIPAYGIIFFEKL